MKACIYLLAAVLAMGFGSSAGAQDAPIFKNLVGNWEFESEAVIAPGQPKVKAKGTEKVKAVGAFWVVLESKLSVAGMAMDTVMTIGAGSPGGTLEGTWISSMSGKMVVYKGTLSKDGNTIELMTEMPNPAKGGQMTKHKDVVAMQGNDKRTLKSYAFEDGKWIEYLSATYKRVK